MNLVSKIEKKRLKEQRVVEMMIRLYCNKNHGTKGAMCEDCQVLCNYAQDRSAKCRFMETKTFCAHCKVHCYKPDMREKIRTVMRFSGPRMIIYHPLMAIWHVICTIKQKHQMKKTAQNHK